MNMIEELEDIKAELLRKADTIDYCIRMLKAEGVNIADNGSQVNEFTHGKANNLAEKKIAKKRLKSTVFTETSRTIPSVVPIDDGGVFMTEDEFE